MSHDKEECFECRNNEPCFDRLEAELRREKLARERAQEALATYPRGHNHWDNEGTHGLNCYLCIRQRVHETEALAAIEAILEGK